MEQASMSADDGKMSAGAAARLEAQNATQWLVRMTRSFASAASNEDDVGLRWRRASQTIVTPDIAPDTALELAVRTLTFQFTVGGKPSPHALDPDGKSSAEIEAWLLVEMLHRDFDREAFSKNLPYELPRLMTGDEAKYNPESMSAELDQLGDRLSEAAGVLIEARKQLGAGDGCAEDELVYWPETFDIGFTAPLWEQTAGAEKVKVGYTLGDEKGVPPGFFIRRAGGTPPVSLDLAARSQADAVASLLQAFKTMRSGAAH